MQVVSPSSPAQKFAGKERFPELYGKLNNDFGSKLKIASTTEQEHRDHHNLEKSWFNQNAQSDGKARDQEEEEEEDDEFSFASVNAENSPITAEEAFEDGQIRPVYPLFNRNLLYVDDPKEETLRSPLKKLFVEATTTAEEEEEDDEEEPMGPYCSWKGRTVVEASPETCRKSNSTGFSKLWRFKDLVLRSNSDGRDAFVFLSNGRDDNKNKSTSSSSSVKSKRTEKEKEKTKTEKKKKMRTKSAHEKLYTRNRAMREEGKRRSFLPYKHVGFFTNVNGLTRNVNPF